MTFLFSSVMLIQDVSSSNSLSESEKLEASRSDTVLVENNDEKTVKESPAVEEPTKKVELAIDEEYEGLEEGLKKIGYFDDLTPEAQKAALDFLNKKNDETLNKAFIRNTPNFHLLNPIKSAVMQNIESFCNIVELIGDKCSDDFKTDFARINLCIHSTLTFIHYLLYYTKPLQFYPEISIDLENVKGFLEKIYTILDDYFTNATGKELYIQNADAHLYHIFKRFFEKNEDLRAKGQDVKDDSTAAAIEGFLKEDISSLIKKTQDGGSDAEVNPTDK